jgi:hypothetical protein
MNLTAHRNVKEVHQHRKQLTDSIGNNRNNQTTLVPRTNEDRNTLSNMLPNSRQRIQQTATERKHYKKARGLGDIKRNCMQQETRQHGRATEQKVQGNNQ